MGVTFVSIVDANPSFLADHIFLYGRNDELASSLLEAIQ